MSDYDPDRVTLGPTVASTRVRKVGKVEPLLVPLDAELAEAILMLGDYFPAARKAEMIGKVFSLLFLSLLNEDPDMHIDSMERIIAPHLDPGGEDTGKLWGEFLSIISVFTDTYENDSLIKESLEDLLVGDLRVFPEEMFLVKWSRGANYLLVE